MLASKKLQACLESFAKVVHCQCRTTTNTKCGGNLEIYPRNLFIYLFSQLHNLHVIGPFLKTSEPHDYKCSNALQRLIYFSTAEKRQG